MHNRKLEGKMKKICILFNHFQFQDGVARTAVGLANELAKNREIEVVLRPLFKYDKKMLETISMRIKVEPVLKLYFRGLVRLVDLIPDRLLYKIVFRKKYDIEIGFGMSLPIKIVGSSQNKLAKHYAWIHGYNEGLTLKRYYEKMDKVISVSKCNAERFEAETQGLIPVDYCYNLVDDDVIRAMGTTPINVKKTEELTFVTVGRHSEEKGFLRLIECVNRLRKEGFKLKLWLIGDGPQHEELIKKSLELGLEDEVYFAGGQQNPHAYTAKADVFVCSSFVEGYSTACTEAIMLNIPVLTTDVSGGREIIDEAQSGMLVGKSDEDLYNGMKTILEHPELIVQWKQTLEKTKDKFSYKYRAERLWEVLELQ